MNKVDVECLLSRIIIVKENTAFEAVFLKFISFTFISLNFNCRIVINLGVWLTSKIFWSFKGNWFLWIIYITVNYICCLLFRIVNLNLNYSVWVFTVCLVNAWNCSNVIFTVIIILLIVWSYATNVISVLIWTWYFIKGITFLGCPFQSLIKTLVLKLFSILICPFASYLVKVATTSKFKYVCYFSWSLCSWKACISDVFSYILT